MGRPESSIRRPVAFLDRHLSSLSLTRTVEADENSHGPLGLNLLHTPADPRIDFVFVHGLRGGSRKTWSKTEHLDQFWPQQWLPSEPRFEHVRIHSFGYNSDWAQGKGMSLTIHDFGQSLLGELYSSPQISGSGIETPLVFIGHSMGGIVIKKMFLLAKQDPNYQNLASRIHSMFFLATPHRGADSAQLLSNILRLSVSHTPKPYVDDLKSASSMIQVVNDEFRHVYSQVQLWSFFETIESSVGLIVAKDSAVLGLPGERVQLLNADHRNVCKFSDKNDSNYCTIRNSFVSAIDSIEKTWLALQKTEHRAQMRLLSQYLGVDDGPEADLTSALEAKVEGTCEWLTTSTSFQAWMDGSEPSRRHYWLTGRPASGKSILSGHVIQHLQNSEHDCIFFFFKDGDSAKSTISEMLRSFAWQMAWINLDVRRVLLEMESHGESFDKSDARSIWRTLFVTRIWQVRIYQPCFWILDALDECSDHSTLLPLLARIDQSFPIRLFLTSRPSPLIERIFSQEKIAAWIQTIGKENSRHDIQLFLEMRSQYLPVDSQPEHEALVGQILEKSDGNFLWVSLVLKELENIVSKEQIREVLRSVPEGMDGLYARILDKLSQSGRSKDLAKAVLRWTIYSSRPLTVEELRDAIQLDIGESPSQLEKTVGPLCGHLVYVDGHSRIRVAHQTVRAFLYQEHDCADFNFDRQEEHLRLLLVCLKYLCGEELKTMRHRRGNTSARPSNRSAFADYAIVHFGDHLIRATSSQDSQLIALNSFLKTNSLTWIELIAKTADLSPLIQTAKSFKTYLERRAKYCSPLGEEVQNVTAWSQDLIQLVARFGSALLQRPSAIQFLIPPICPPNSAIARMFANYPRALQMAGLLHKEWDDHLHCVKLSDAQALSIACCDNKFAVGGSDGKARIYRTTTFQEEQVLNHGEPVRSIAFGAINNIVATAGRRNINLWKATTGTLLRNVTTTDPILTFGFNIDNTLLMAATRANTLIYWDSASGDEVDTFQFTDVNDDQGGLPAFARSPTHVAYSAELNLLAVAYRSRPVSVWDLEDCTLVGQFHKTGKAYPGPIIFALIINENPGLGLAAVAYDDGDLVVFDIWSQTEYKSITAEAAILASSPDGTLLVAGDGIGAITLYEFETLRMLYRLNSFEQNIRTLMFNSNNLMFFDIRGSYCNVWEPSVLVRKQDVGETTSIDVSEEVSVRTLYGETKSFDDDHTITALTPDDKALIFCGREDGSVCTFSAATGELINEIFSHATDTAVIFIEWSQAGRYLASIDLSGRLLIHKVAKSDHAETVVSVELVLENEIPHPATQLLFDPSGTKVLVSMTQGEQLWSIKDTELLCARESDIVRPLLSWISHPSDPEKLLKVADNRIQIYNWTRLEEISKPEGIDLGFENAHLRLLGFACDNVLCLAPPAVRSTNVDSNLYIFPTNNMNEESATVKNMLEYGKLAKFVRLVLGFYKSRLIFLTYSGWICSLAVGFWGRRQSQYTRHFYIPLQLYNCDEDAMMFVTSRGSIGTALRDEIVVFHNGLDFEEEVELEARSLSTRVSTRMGYGMRRTSPAGFDRRLKRAPLPKAGQN